MSDSKLVVGVLSATDVVKFRNAIRKSWGGAEARRHGVNVLFLVAGPWTAISEEFDHCRDLFWINMKDSYREALT